MSTYSDFTVESLLHAAERLENDRVAFQNLLEVRMNQKVEYLKEKFNGKRFDTEILFSEDDPRYKKFGDTEFCATYVTYYTSTYFEGKVHRSDSVATITIFFMRDPAEYLLKENRKEIKLTEKERKILNDMTNYYNVKHYPYNMETSLRDLYRELRELKHGISMVQEFSWAFSFKSIVGENFIKSSLCCEDYLF